MNFYDWAVMREREKCNDLMRKQTPLGCRKNVETKSISYGNECRQYIRVFIPKDRSKIQGYMVNIHGGGLIAGEIAQNQNFCDWMASQFGMVVFAVEYRLMPEVRFYEQLEDIVSAFDLIERELRDRTHHPIYLVADSAGCHLALIANAIGREDLWFAEEFNVSNSHNLLFDGVWLNAPMIQTVGFNEIGIFMAPHWYKHFGRNWKHMPFADWLKHPEKLFEYLPSKVVIITSNGDKLKDQAYKAWNYIDKHLMGTSVGVGRKCYEHDWNVLDPVRDGFTRDMNRWAVDALTKSEWEVTKWIYSNFTT